MNHIKVCYRRLFQNYLIAIQFKIQYYDKKIDSKKYLTLHSDALIELNAVRNDIDRMKSVEEKYFSSIKNIIFDIPYIPINYEYSEDSRIIKPATIKYLFSNQLPVPLHSDAVVLGGSNINHGFFNLFIKFFESHLPVVDGGSAKDNIKFIDPLTQKYYIILASYYNIITYKVPSEITKARQLLEIYTKKLHNYEYDYKKNSHPDFSITMRYKRNLELCILNGYKEFNVLAISLQN